MDNRTGAKSVSPATNTNLFRPNITFPHQLTPLRTLLRPRLISLGTSPNTSNNPSQTEIILPRPNNPVDNPSQAETNHLTAKIELARHYHHRFWLTMVPYFS